MVWVITLKLNFQSVTNWWIQLTNANYVTIHAVSDKTYIFMTCAYK